MILSHIGAQGITVFNTLILMIGIATAIAYGFSALAQIRWRLNDRGTIPASRLAVDLIMATISLVLSLLFVVYSTDTQATGFQVYAPYAYLLGVVVISVPIYLLNRSRMTAPPAPPRNPAPADGS